MELDPATVAIVTAILTVGVALAGLILRQSVRIDSLQAQMLDMRNRLEDRIDAGQAQMERRFEVMERRFDALREQNNHLQERVARIEGILTGRPLLADEPAEARATS